MFIFSVDQEVRLLKDVAHDNCEVCGRFYYNIYLIKDILKPLLIFKICIKKVYIAQCISCDTTYTLSKDEVKKLLQI